MAVVTIVFQKICDADNHLRLTASLDGGVARQFAITTDDLLESWTVDKAEVAIVALLRLHFKGRTRAQIKAEIAGGLSLTV